ncbi:hypothetical protein KEM54_006184 [Ascosphaera aggregata]|nr:hypothetical protein KEM54_006184 [Ascosphaera aggregata]
MLNRSLGVGNLFPDITRLGGNKVKQSGSSLTIPTLSMYVEKCQINPRDTANGTTCETYPARWHEKLRGLRGWALHLLLAMSLIGRAASAKD